MYDSGHYQYIHCFKSHKIKLIHLIIVFECTNEAAYPYNKALNLAQNTVKGLLTELFLILDIGHLFLILDIEHLSENINLYYQSPVNDDTRCNYYGKDGNTGPDYDCNQIGWEVVVRRWDTAVLGLCNIKVYGGK